MTRSSPFLPGSPPSQTLLRWHASLDDNRGERAALRRADSPGAVALRPAFIYLLGEIEPGWPGGRHALTEEDRERLAAIAGLAAHVREVTPADRTGKGTSAFARQMAGFDPNLPVSQIRFRRLLEQERIADLYGTLVRVIRILDRRVDLLDLARSVHDWGPEMRKRWAYAYYPTALAKDQTNQDK